MHAAVLPPHVRQAAIPESLLSRESVPLGLRSDSAAKTWLKGKVSYAHARKLVESFMQCEQHYIVSIQYHYFDLIFVEQL